MFCIMFCIMLCIMFCVIRRYFLKIPSYYNTEAFLLQAGLSDFSIGKVKIRYCSHGYVPRGVFVHFLHENPELHGAKLCFCSFCASRSGLLFTPCRFWHGGNSNLSSAPPTTSSVFSSPGSRLGQSSRAGARIPDTGCHKPVLPFHPAHRS